MHENNHSSEPLETCPNIQTKSISIIQPQLHTNSSEPILFPKIRIYFAEFLYLHSSII